MKRNLLLLVIIISYFGSLSQESDNFYTIKTNLDMYFDSVINIYGLENMQGRDYNPYMRWVDYWQPILYPHGDFVIERQQHEQYISEFISGNITYSYTPFELEWNLIGPNSMPEGTQRWAKGLGQIHYIAFDPNDTLYLKMFACSPVGGLWKSFDGGENWINAGTDKGLPRCGVSCIAFDPDNSDTNWFISTGNAESMPGRFIWQNSIGVARTTDGGGSWEIIGLTNVLRMRKLISTKYQGNVVLLVATTNGVYVCMDALSAQPQFVKLIDGDFYDVEFDPLSFGTAYASGTGLNSSVYSLDWINSTHEELQNLEMIPSHEGRRLIIDISPAAPENLFIVATYWGGPNTSYLYRYNLSSSTIISKGMLPKADLNEPGVGPERAMGWTISPVLIDSNLVMVYGNTAPIRRSDNLLDNNPCTWTNVTSNYHSCEIHVDMHHMTFSPDGQVLWVGNDGGVFKSQMPDLLNNWQDKCNGLAVATVYHLGISDKNRNIAMSGAFDCGVNLFTKTNGNWSAKHVVAGDGFQCIFNWRYPDTLWTSIQKTAYRSYNLGQTFHSIGGNFHFHSFFIQNKSYPNILYGTNDFGLRRSIQYGNNWHNHANFPGVTNNRTWRVANSFSNSDYIYISWIGNTQGDHQKVFKTVNGGGLNTEDWEDIGSPLEDKWINSIAIDYFNPDKIWVGAGGNVYSVNTLSKEWTNLSDGLPSYIDIKHLEILPGTSDVLFAGTNLGLFLYLEQDREWKKIAGNLPNTIVRDIHIDVYNSRIAVSTFGRGIWEADLPCFSLEETTQILSNEIWSQDRYIRGDLVIEPNVTLEIDNVYIRMNENSKIIIKPGAKLDVNGGKVTSFCNLPWQGIQVWGNKQQSQWPDQYGVLHQGMLELKNGAIIENAIDAVALWNPGDYNSTGGIVVANDAIFRNNTKAVHALMYWNFNPLNPEERLPNRSYFKNCTFELTEDYHGDETFYKHVDLFDVFGIDFRVCNFTLHPEADNVDKYNHGIAAYSAGFSLLPVCVDPNTIPCPGYLKNTFNGFNRAVSSSDALTYSPPFFVNRAAFSNNDNGVHVNEVNNFTILNSSFDVGKQNSKSECMKADGVGIYTNESTGFAIQENNFTKYIAAPSGIYLGAWINNTREADEVYKNYFSDLSYANYSEGINWRDPDRFIGLAYFCNQNQNNYADFYVGRDSLNRGGIQSDQGYWEHAAGNAFTQSGATWHFYNDGEHLLRYFYNQNIADQAPDLNKVFNVSPVAINYNNNCPSYYGGGDDEKPMAMSAAEQQQAEMQFMANLADYNIVKALYTALTDGGDTDGTVFNIQTAHPDDMWALRAQLLGKSPHLSMVALKEASDRTDVFNDAALFDILAANPDELKKEELILYLEQKEEPLPDYMVNILKQVATGTTYKTVLEQQMSRYNREKTRAAHNMIRHIVTDSIVDNNLLRQWLNNLGGIQADKQIIGTFVQEGNFADALALTNMLPQLYALQEDELMAHNAYVDMLNLHHSLHQQGRNLFQLTEVEKQELDQISSGAGTAALQARAIREMVYNEYIEPCPCVDETGSFKNAPINLQSPALASLLEITARPNPARDWVVFEYRLPGESPEASIRITDGGGRIIAYLPVSGNRGQKMWDTRGLEPGIYFYALIKAGQYKSGKIVIHR